MSGTKRNLNFDILRIMAALMVLTVHVGYQFPWIQDHTFYGFYGTTLFFVMSGYLGMKSMENCSNAMEFYKKRVIRIIPIYWGILVISYLFDAIQSLISGNYAAFTSGGICSISRVRYFLFMQMILPSDNFSLWNNKDALWTMSAFFVFYLIAPLLYKLLKKFYVSLVLLIILLFTNKPLIAYIEKIVANAYGEGADAFSFASFFPLSVMYAFVGGITVYLAVKEQKQIVFVVLGVLSLIYNGFQWFPWDIAFMILVMCAASLPSIEIRNDYINKLINLFSKFSFALYLSHPIILGPVMKLKDIMVPYIRNKGFLAFVVIVCILTGYLCWAFIEEPLTKAAKKIIKT